MSRPPAQIYFRPQIYFRKHNGSVLIRKNNGKAQKGSYRILFALHAKRKAYARHRDDNFDNSIQTNVRCDDEKKNQLLNQCELEFYGMT